MGLFDKKECGVCGKKVGMLGSRKVDDGVICSDCNKKLSPFFSERKRSTVADIQQQLAYREQNRQNLNSFNATRTLGFGSTKVIIDDNQRKFVVSQKNDFRAENADIIDFTQVSSARMEIDEDRTELFQEDANGNSRSYTPPRYDYDYDIYVYINVNHPYFSEIKIKINSFQLQDRYTEDFHRCENAANEIVMALSGGAMGGMGGYQQQQPMGGYQQQPNMGYQQMPNQGNMAYQQAPQQGYQQPVQQGYQQQPQQGFQQTQAAAQWFCPNCGTPNTSNFCQSCGTQKP
ncbi:MAG: DUF4428 domain-containing protein [Eubacterium sp.]|nr:DUF4428 domain-containing protein [Eubacterium sp.]